MSHQDETVSNRPERRLPDGYEPPRVEKALTPAELEREVLYAGTPGDIFASVDSDDG
jgi:hypothetical protein